MDNSLHKKSQNGSKTSEISIRNGYIAFSHFTMECFGSPFIPGGGFF